MGGTRGAFWFIFLPLLVGGSWQSVQRQACRCPSSMSAAKVRSLGGWAELLLSDWDGAARPQLIAWDLLGLPWVFGLNAAAAP